MYIKRIFAILAVLCVMAMLPLTVLADQSAPEQLVYDFTFSGDGFEYGDFAGAGLTGESVCETFARLYEEGTLNWLYFSDNTDLICPDAEVVDNVFYFGRTESYKWDGIRLGVCARYLDGKDYPAGYWLALTINVPADGAYMMTLDYQTRADGTTAGEIYLLEGTYIDNIDIDGELEEDLLVGTVDFFKKTWDIEPATAELGEVLLTAGEHTLVFRADQKDGNDVSAYMYLSAVRLDRTPLREQASQVDALIANGEIKAARAAYDALTPGAKTYVMRVDDLLAAEAANSKMSGLIVAAVVVAVLAAGVVVAVVVIKKKKPEQQ